MIYQWLIAACWLAFIIVWLIASFGAKPTTRHFYGMWWMRLIFIVAVVLAVESGVITRQSTYLWASPSVHDPALGSTGVLLCALGVAFAIWARVYLGSNWGMPMSVKTDPELVVSGPYAYVRHPIYTGVLLAMLGTSFVVGFWWVIVFVISGAYFIFAATREEKLMQKTFPDQYPLYKKRTKMLIPFVW